MDVTGATTTPAQQAAGQTNPAASNTDYQMFLKMLTTQMKNQDPLNPVDSTDYATQLATFSGVEQQVQTNQLLQSLVGQLGVSGMAQLASWVGMDAKAAAPAVFSGVPITLYPSPAQGADSTMLVAYDAQKREISRQQIPVSSDPISWTGKDANGNPIPNGVYTFKLESVQAGTVIADDVVAAYSKVTETQQGAGGAVLVLDSGATVLPADVKALRPGTGS